MVWFSRSRICQGSHTLMLDKATSIEKAQPLANPGVERQAVITAAAINPVPTAFEKQLNCSFFS